jgi:hypothetical protein
VENWPTQRYEQQQQPGDLIFIREQKTGNGRSFPTLVVAQLNEMFLHCYNKLVSLGRAQPVKKHGIISIENVPQEVPTGVLALQHSFMELGEDVFEDDKTWNSLCNDKQFSPFVGVSMRQIMHFYRFLGLYASDGGRYAKPHLTYNIVVGGPTTYQEAFNLWGPLTEGHNVFLILTRRPNPTAGSKIYGAFYFKPYACKEDFPPSSETIYYDEAGIMRYGKVIPVGRVYRTPLEKADSEEQRNIKSGITSTSHEAFQTRITTVPLIMGARRCCRDLFDYA